MKYAARCCAFAGVVFTAILPILLAGCATPQDGRLVVVPKWTRFEHTFKSTVAYANPFQETTLWVALTSPSGETRVVHGFWDGDAVWRVRFLPDEVGRWHFTTECSDADNRGLHRRSGSFICTAATGRNRFERHGPVRVSRTGRFLAHADGTPFFWLGEAGWNAPLQLDSIGWRPYLSELARQKFTVLQWVATQWSQSPRGDYLKRAAYSGHDRIAVNPDFFRQLDDRVDEMNRAGILAAPVLLWAALETFQPHLSPGSSLSEEQAVLLARYMVARWQGNHVAWILNGDADMREARGERWKRIGRAVFLHPARAPVAVHPAAGQWPFDEFKDEEWLDVAGYQSGASDGEMEWLLHGPPARAGEGQPAKPLINLGRVIQPGEAVDASAVRRGLYRSLLTAPTAGVTHSGNAETRRDGRAVADIFTGVDFSRLAPDAELLGQQGGREDLARFVSAARSGGGGLVMIYTADARMVSVRLDRLPPNSSTIWRNARTGEAARVVAVVTEQTVDFPKPSEEDWVLLLEGK